MPRIRLHEELIPGPDGQVLLRHLAVRGSNAEIGRASAELAISRYGLRPEALLADGRFVRARRTDFERNYPIHAQRMRGVAAAFGLRADDDRFDFSILRVQAGDGQADALTASATYSPPWTTDTGHGLLCRTAKLPDLPMRQLELYLMEWHPSGAAYASIALHAFDLLSGTVQGINSTGLAVVAVASPELRLTNRGPLDKLSRTVPAVGLHELGLLRFVLDTCATVDDAQAALLGARAFRMVTPAHYLIADRSGRSFTYEASVDGSAQQINDGAAEPQVIGTPSARSAAKADLQRTQWWRCVVDQERHILEVRFGLAPGGLAEHTGRELRLSMAVPAPPTTWLPC